MNLASTLDPNIAALLGSTGGNDQFAQLLLQSINPNAAKEVESSLGFPSLGPLSNAMGSAPPIATGFTAPGMPGPQAMQTLGFGMAAAAGKPGSTGLSALGEGGTALINQGSAEADRSIREAQQENQANIAEWEGKSKLAEAGLNAQMKGPELDQKMLDLTGQTLARDENQRDLNAYRAAALSNAAGKIGVQQQNADTAKARVGVSQQRADTYDQKVTGDQDLAAKKLAQAQTRIDQQASQFQQKLLQDSAASGARIGLNAAQAAATEFKNEMTLRKNPITGELPDEATQQALRESITAKYQRAAAPATSKNAPSIDPQQALEQAQAALAAGADPVKVRQRLVGLGIDPAGLGS